MSKKIYVVMGKSGFDPVETWAVKAFSDEHAAKVYAKTCLDVSFKARRELEGADVSICFACGDEIDKATALGYIVQWDEYKTDILHPVTGLPLRPYDERYSYEEITLDE
jgi:hypothetical protein